jgi:glycosyltransferase involved in cell wall biosynthesis
MKVLLLHNRYREAGGEDAVVSSESYMLRCRGLDVIELQVSNESAGNYRAILKAGLASCWSYDSYRAVREICARERPDVAHLHNFWMKLSPSVHAACHSEGVATVQTLHNFRLLCANALFLRDGRPCEDCLGALPWRGVLRRCYRDSSVASAAVAGMVMYNHCRGTWQKDVDAFIALSSHSRSKFVTGGLPADRIFIKPNVVEDLGTPQSPPSSSCIIVYAGRLSGEKGVNILLEAWSRAHLPSSARMVLIGDGPLHQNLQAKAKDLGLRPPHVIFRHKLPNPEVLHFIANARAVVVPSICYENFPRAVVEAFVSGRPAIVSDIGALGEIVRHNELGIKFRAGDVVALSAALERLISDDAHVDRMGRNARAEYESTFAPGHNFQMLMKIYDFAMRKRTSSCNQS